MVTATIGELRGGLADYVERVAQDGQRVVVTRHGKPAVAIVNLGDLDMIERIERKIDEHIARIALAEMDERGAVSLEDVLRRASALDGPERLKLLEVVSHDLAAGADGSRQKHSIMELEGLGAEIWAGVDTKEYINGLRKEWDRRP